MITPIRVLIIDDSIDDAMLLIDELKDNAYEPAYLRVDTLETMDQALREQTWDIIIADYRIPGFGGVEALKALKDTGLDIPFILVSGTAPENTGVDLMRSGAQDFVLKHNLSRLAPAVARELADVKTRAKHRQAEDNAARLAAIVESSEDAVIGKTLDGIITSWNRGAEKMYGYTAAEAVGQPFDIVVPPDLREESAAFLDVVRRGEAVSRYETERVTKAGHRLYVSTSVSPIKDRNGAIVGASTISRDVTELKLAEQRERDTEAHKREFYRRTILAATEGKLVISEPREIESIAGDTIRSWRIENLSDVHSVRDDVRNLATENGMDESRAYGFMACAVEALANVHKHASGGTATLHRTPENLTLVVSDTGPGIEALALPDVALTKGYTTAVSLGMGYKVMIEFADRVYLATGPEGTVVAVQMALNTGLTASEALLQKLSGW